MVNCQTLWYAVVLGQTVFVLQEAYAIFSGFGVDLCEDLFSMEFDKRGAILVRIFLLIIGWEFIYGLTVCPLGSALCQLRHSPDGFHLEGSAW